MTKEELKKTEETAESIESKKKKKWPWIVGGIVVLFIIIGAAGSSNQPQKVGESKTDTTKNAEEKPSTQTYKVGDQVKLKENVLTVYSIADYKSANEFMTPQSGKKYVVADIGIQNDGKEAIDYNTFDFKLQDNQDYSYDSSFSDKSPAFSSGTLQSGQKTRGFITYEITETNNATKIIFTPSFWSNEQIIINL